MSEPSVAGWTEKPAAVPPYCVTQVPSLPPDHDPRSAPAQPGSLLKSISKARTAGISKPIVPAKSMLVNIVAKILRRDLDQRTAVRK